MILCKDLLQVVKRRTLDKEKVDRFHQNSKELTILIISLNLAQVAVKDGLVLEI